MTTRVCLGVLSFLSLCLCGDPSSLESRLLPLVKAHKGKVAIAVRHLGSGESYYLNSDEPMPTASLIKLPVMLELYQQAEEGKVKLTERVTLHADDKVPGSGILTNHFSDGTSFTLRDACRLMIALSDNTATNMVLDKIGIMPVNRRMEAWGYPNTKINAKSFKGSTTSVAPERTKKYGLGSTTAREMIAILEDLETCKHCRPVVKQVILNHLRKCDDKDKFPRFLPDGVDIAHKTGSVSNARTDAGIMYLPSGPIALCVMTNENEDTRWKPDNGGNEFCAKVAKEVYEHFIHVPSKHEANVGKESKFELFSVNPGSLGALCELKDEPAPECEPFPEFAGETRKELLKTLNQCSVQILDKRILEKEPRFAEGREYPKAAVDGKMSWEVKDAKGRLVRINLKEIKFLLNHTRYDLNPPIRSGFVAFSLEIRSGSRSRTYSFGPEETTYDIRGKVLAKNKPNKE